MKQKKQLQSCCNKCKGWLSSYHERKLGLCNACEGIEENIEEGGV